MTASARRRCSGGNRRAYTADPVARRFLAEHFLILDPWQVGLRFPKYAWAYRSSFQWLNCLLFQDWYRLYLDHGGAPIKAGASLRGFRGEKKVLPSVKWVVNRLWLY
jgi:hypothetical protein